MWENIEEMCFTAMNTAAKRSQNRPTRPVVLSVYIDQDSLEQLKRFKGLSFNVIQYYKIFNFWWFVMIKIDYGYNISYLGQWSSFYLMKYPILPLDGNSRS